MNVTQEEVLGFLEDVNKLSRRRKPLFIEAVYEKRDTFQATKESYATADGFEKWRTETQPKGRAWHWVWCIASQATIAVVEDITPEIWAEARAMLDEALAQQEETQSASRAKYNKERP